MAAPQDLIDILNIGEAVEMYIKQKFYRQVDIDSVAITDIRIILRHPHSLGIEGDYSELDFIDLDNVYIDKGLTTSTITVTHRFGAEPLLLNDLPNAQAEEAYFVIRETLNKYRSCFNGTHNFVFG